MSKQRVLLSLLTFAVAILSIELCHAQIFRGKFRNNRVFQSRSATPTPTMDGTVEQRPNQHAVHSHRAPLAATADQTSPRTVFPIESYFSNQSHPFVSRLLDGKMTYRHRDPREVDSRYIGGFHQSYFHNIGIPSGDIGLRGNGLHFRPW